MRLHQRQIIFMMTHCKVISIQFDNKNHINSTNICWLKHLTLYAVDEMKVFLNVSYIRSKKFKTERKNLSKTMLLWKFSAVRYVGLRLWKVKCLFSVVLILLLLGFASIIVSLFSVALCLAYTSMELRPIDYYYPNNE